MNRLKFEGKGFDFFKIQFINVILTILSLSFLYPWAKVRELRYVCQNLSLADSALAFTGTINEFFKGYLKTVFFIIVPLFLIGFGGGIATALYKDTLFSGAIYSLTMFLAFCFSYFMMPIVLHGTLNYRLSNISWLSIYPKYLGKQSELFFIIFYGSLLTMITAGIYKAWLQVKLTKYILKNIRFGSLRFDFSGDAKTLFFIYLKGFFLTLITFGIYSIWFFKQIYEYSVNNIVVKKDDQEFKLLSNANALEVFEMMVGNFLLIILTLGIGASWAYIRYYKFIFEHCIIPADFNINSIMEAQEAEEANLSKPHWLDRWNPKFII